MMPQRLPLVMRVGAQFDPTFAVMQSNGLPVDNTGSVATMIVASSSTAVPILSISSTPNSQGRIINGLTAGTWQPIVLAAITLAFTPGPYWYQLDIVDSLGAQRPLLYGPSEIIAKLGST